jgi:chemotaxis protein methyltransferase CheR
MGPALPQAILEMIADALADGVGLSLAEGLRMTLEGAVAAAAADRGEAADAFASRVLARDPEAVARLAEHAVVKETFFWRHPEQLEALGRWGVGHARPLAIWSAGCATGEEPYSAAIALLEAGRGGIADRIVGTDLSDRALAEAREARYGPRALRRLPPALVGRHLEPAGPDGARRVGAAARGRVTLARHNLVRDPPPGGPFDVILCRNVLIYFEPSLAAAVLVRLADALRPGGALVLGPVELPLASALPLGWVQEGGATLLVRGR